MKLRCLFFFSNNYEKLSSIFWIELLATKTKTKIGEDFSKIRASVIEKCGVKTKIQLQKSRKSLVRVGKI